jgi:2'-5' RNA ligase
MGDYIGYEVPYMGFPAHLTLMYLGHIKDNERFKYIMECMTAITPSHMRIPRKRIAMLGADKQTPALLVEFDKGFELISELNDWGIESTSRYPYNPHITLNMKSENTIRIPHTIHLANPYIKYRNNKYYI